jgi:quercetin dioxygenase-like cupin family protein
MIQIVHIPDAPVIPTPTGLDARRLHDSEPFQVMHINLKPGERVAPHTIPVDTAFFVLEGTGIAEIGGESAEVERDTLVFSPADSLRGLFNNSDAPFRVLVIRAPRPQM